MASLHWAIVASCTTHLLYQPPQVSLPAWEVSVVFWWDELLDTNIDSAKLCRSTGNHLIQLLASPSASDTNIVEHIVGKLGQPTDKISRKGDSEKMWSECHKVCSSDEYGKNICCLSDANFLPTCKHWVIWQILKEKLHSLQERMYPETTQEDSITLEHKYID